jgi:predicted DCC family thiol-disulfide oxidoreductase YuxK
MPDPAHPTILFDGLCNFCHGGVRWIIAKDPHARFRFAPLQSPVGRALLAQYAPTVNPEAPDSLVLIDNATAHLRSDAALHIARTLGFPWSLARPLLFLPRPLRDALYNLVARNRYRWFGRKEACPLPTPEFRARFIDTAPPA